VHWEAGEATISVEQLEKAAALFESLENYAASYTQQSSKLELLAQTYRMLQKVLVSLGRTDEALNWAERSRRTKENVTEEVTHYSEIVDRQRAVVLYYRYSIMRACVCVCRSLGGGEKATLVVDG
jgi:hypothetical protein